MGGRQVAEWNPEQNPGVLWTSEFTDWTSELTHLFLLLSHFKDLQRNATCMLYDFGIVLVHIIPLEQKKKSQMSTEKQLSHKEKSLMQWFRVWVSEAEIILLSLYPVEHTLNKFTQYWCINQFTSLSIYSKEIHYLVTRILTYSIKTYHPWNKRL